MRSRGDEILAMAQLMYDTVNEDDVAREGPGLKDFLDTQLSNLHQIFDIYAKGLLDAKDFLDDDATVSKGPKYDLMQAIVMNATAAAVVLASRYIRKRHASATGQKPRGRVPADAEAAASLRG